MKKKFNILLIIISAFLYSIIQVNAEEGWITDENNNTYYYEDDSYVTGIRIIEDKQYYFNDNGVMQTGFIRDTETNKLYFYSRVNGALKTGWQSASEGKWYQNADGEVLTGQQTIENNKYLFNEEGIMQTGFIRDTESNKLYFYSRVNGALKNGWQNSTEGKWYQNDEGEVLTGSQTIDKNKYYFNEEGIMQTGFVRDEETKKIYFYSRVNGALKTGWQNASEGYWYQNKEGELVVGNQTIDARNYYFNEETGFLEGFKYENGKTYYYNPDGTQARGVQYMTNKYWKFNESTGAFEKFVRQIRVIDISQHNGDIDWNKVKQSGLVDAVILRLGFGSYSYDTRFNTNKAELERLGIPYSIYLFSYAERADQAQEEAEFVINSVRNKNINIASNIFGIYYDLEDWTINSTGQNSYGISKDTYGDIITTFVNDVERNLCIKTRVYASKNYIETRFPTGVQGYATWVAQWGNQITYQGAYEGWQYTSKADIPGIPWAWNKDTQQWEPHTDMSIFYY